MLQSFGARILDFKRENSTRQFIWKCLVTLKDAIFLYKKEVVGCLSVVDPVFSVCPKIPVTVRAAEIADVPELKVVVADYKKRKFLQWINDNYIFYIAQLPNPASSIVGYICVCPANKAKSLHKLVSILKLKDTDYWAVDAYIHPAYRGKGINAAIASGLLAQAKKEGFKRGYGSILLKNNASRRSYAFIGEKEIGVFTTITVMGFSFYFLKRNKGYEEFFS